MSSAGYGYMAFRKRHYLTHRASWIAANGREVPEGMCICHSCDNPPCVNPAHLWLGSQKANSADMMSKGRFNAGNRRRGADNHAAKLTPDDVATIKATKQIRGVQKALAERFGVSRMTIYRVQTGENWAGSRHSVTVTPSS